MKYFLDTEFIEDGKSIDLISIALVAEDGREYYAVNTEFKARKASQWVKDNVIAHLPPRYTDPPPIGSPHWWSESLRWKPRRQIRQDILDFVGDDPAPEFWGYYADYDWVVFCWLFGTMMDLPQGFPMYCRDLKQWADQLGVPREMLPADPENVHNALADARWNKDAYYILEGIA